MLLTEEHARTKWCPMVRMAAPGNPLVNRISRAMWAILKPGTRDHEWYSDMKADCCCIASECAMWRWQNGDPDFAEVGEPAKGYCGLAGEAR